MSDTMTSAAPAPAAAAPAPAASTAVDPGAAPAAAPAAAPGADAGNAHDAGTANEADAGSGAPRKSAEEAFAELDQRALKIHKTLATTGERRKLALDWLDPQRDRVRLALANVRMSDADVDSLIDGFVNAGIEAATVS